MLVGAVAGHSQNVSLRLSQYDHTGWTTRDGAPRNINQIQEDNDGTLWLRGGSELYNFDGTVFTLFESKQGDIQLPAEPISSIYESKAGTLWVGFSKGGIAQIRQHRVVKIFDTRDGLPVGEVRQVFEAPDGTTIAIARNRLMQWKGGRWSDLEAASALGGEEVIGCFFERSGTLLVGTSVSLWEQAAGEHQLHRTVEPGGRVFNFAESPDGAVWLAINDPDPKKVRFMHRLFSGEGAGLTRETLRDWRSVMAVDEDGSLWASNAGHGILREPISPKYDVRPRRLDREKDGSVFTHEDGLSSDHGVRVIFQDRARNVWVGTTEGLDRLRKPSIVRFSDKGVASSEGAALTACPDGEIWAGVNERPLFTLRSGIFMEHKPVRETMFLHCDSGGVLWVSDLQGLFRYDHGKTLKIQPPPGVLPIYNHEIVGNSDQLLYVAYIRSGVWRYEMGKWSLVASEGFPKAPPVSLFMDSRKRLWAGFVDNRIAVLDKNNSRSFYADDVVPIGIVYVIEESRYGLLVGGSGGIAVLVGDHLQSLVPLDPSATRGVSGIAEAKNGDLWLNGLRGIVRIRSKEVEEALRAPSYRLHFKLFSEAGVAGPSPSLFQIPSAVKDAKGVFWFSTSNAIVSVDPDSITPSTTPPILSGLTMTVDELPVANNHHISPGYHTVRIRYLGAFLTDQQIVTYRYRLEGADSEWQEVGKRTEAVYTGLKPGTYHFAVMASNGDDVWSAPDQTIQFTVLPSFYQTRAFILLCVAGVFGLFWSALRFRLNQIAQSARERAEARADERVRIARDLHDTLLQAVQGLTLSFGSVSKKLPEGSPDRYSLEHALTTADRILVEGRNRIIQLRTNYSTNRSLAEAFESIAADLNPEQDVQFSLKIEVRIEEVNPEVLLELYNIGREAIANAFRHAEASEVRLTLNCSTDSVVLTISDDGRGFDTQEKVNSPRSGHWGLHDMKQRAEDLGARFECQSTLAVGTEVVVTIPAKRAYSKKP